MIENWPDEVNQIKKWKSQQVFDGKKSRNKFGHKYNSMDKIDRIINFEGKIVDEDLVLDGEYRVNKSGQFIILSPVAKQDTIVSNFISNLAEETPASRL